MVKKYTDSFTVYIKSDDVYKVIGENFETRFDTSNYKLGKPLTKGKKLKSNWIVERHIRCKNHYKVFSIKSKKL